MKFIGQYIQQFIARFRADVYLENISTSSETGVLVVDSDGKITKNTSISGGLASTVTVTNSTSSTNFPIVFHNESNGLLDNQNFEYNPAIATLSIFNINASGNITADNNLTSNGTLVLNNSSDDTVGFIANAYKLRGASGVGQNSDHIFDLRANSRDGAGNATIYSRFLSKIVSVTDGSEQGDIDLIVMADGTLTSGFLITGQDDGTVDATIGSGAASVTTVAGTLTMGSTATLDNNGNLLTNAATATAVALASETTDTTCFPTFATAATGNQALKTHSGFTFNSLTGALSATKFETPGVVECLGLIAGASGISSTSTNADPSGPVLNLTKNRNGASAVNNDEAGEIQFNGVNDAGTPETIAYAQILSSSAIVTDGDERGKLELKVANDGTLRNGITFLGTDTAQEVDVTIANGAASLTTIAGDLQINGNDIKDSGGNTIMSSNGSGDVTFGGTNIFLDGSNANLKFDSGSDIILGNDVNGGDGASNINYRDSGGTARIMLGPAGSDVVALSNRASNGTVQIRANTSTAGASGEVTVATFEDDKVTISNSLQVDDVNINGSRITLVGSTNDMCVIDCTTNGATTITTTDATAAQANLALIADGNIDFTGSAVSANTDSFNVISSTSSRPIFQIHNSTNDATGGTLDLFNKRNGVGVDGDVLGNIIFTGPNHDGSETITYSSIIGSILESNDTDEAGYLQIKVATSDGSTSASQNGITFTGHSSDNNVSVVIGYGSTSVTRIVGDISIDGSLIANKRRFDLPVDGAGNSNGDVIYIGTNDGSSGGSLLTAGKIYYYKANGAWEEAQADDVATSGPVLLGVALGTTPTTHGVLLRGTVDLSEDITGTEGLGMVLYLDDANAAAATVTQPADSGDIIRIIGYALSTSNTNKIWFNPDNTFVEYTT